MHAHLVLSGLLVLAGTGWLAAQAPSRPLPPAMELRDLLATNLPGITAGELDQAMAAGLLDAFRRQVLLRDAAPPDPTNRTEFHVIEGRVLVARVARLTEGFAARLREEISARSQTNQWIGLGLDLRFATGDDYAAAAAVGDLFISSARPLLDWGDGMISAQAKTNACDWPVVVLVNRETQGAAEATAALLRDLGVGLIVGNTTAGVAMTGGAYRLSNGQTVRIANRPIKLGSGTELSPAGIEPDIRVVTSLEAERMVWVDPYGEEKSASTNAVTSGTNSSPRRVRTNEADLVRARREGVSVNDENLSPRPVVAEPPVLRDPALARAVDVLKGLAVVRRVR